MNQDTRLSGKGLRGRLAGSSAMRPVLRPTQRALTGQPPHEGLRVQTVAPRSISAWV
jgi:hypothetical protein